jgi:hypothetical protein
MTVPQPSSALSRLKGAGVFLAIVWSVALSFVLFDLVVLAIGGRLAEAGVLPAAVERSQVCVASASQAEAVDPAPPGVRSDAWMLGMRSGLYARAALMLAEGERTVTPQTRNWLQGVRGLVAGSSAEIDRLSATLQVPRPAPFVPTNPAMENVDFPTFLEGESNQTAKRLTAAYGPDVCRIFQMGAYWGHSALVRTALPGEPNIHAAEIRHYAQLIRLPEPLWQRMVNRTAPDATGATLAADVDTATTGIATYLRSPDPPAGAEPK